MKSLCSFVVLAVLASSAQQTTAFLSPQCDRPTTMAQRGSFRPGPTAMAMTADPGAKKETTWDRITGPKLFKTVTNWEGIHSVPLVPLRIMTGLLMIHHGSEGELCLDGGHPLS